MFTRVRSFLRRHPLVRDAVLWAVPALVFGAALRLLLLSYQPYAYWGSDSRSYFSFAHKLLTEGYISLDEKRRFLYPFFMVPVSALPGAPLKWLAWIQHGIGLASLVPLAYLVRKCLVHWRLWIVPVTLLYAGWPMILWYEHELLGETIFFVGVLWAFAGWVAWEKEPQLVRSLRLWWLFFVPFAVVILTKPSGRFMWPGVLVGLVVVAAWRKLRRPQWIALALLLAVTLFVGSKKQGAWLLYVATFPLTQIDTPLHAEYKAEIRPDVERFRQNLDVYYLLDDWPFSFLEDPGAQDERPLWKALGKNEKLRSRLYTDLALEGIMAEPQHLFYLGVQKLVGSINPSEFKEDRFTSGFYRERFPHHYEDARKRPQSPVRFALGYGASDPMPEYADFERQLAPRQDSWMERVVVGWVATIERLGDFVRLPDDPDEYQRQIAKTQVRPLGWWLLASLVLAIALPHYRRSFGVWSIVALGYLAAVFLVSQINPRYLAPAWPVLVPVLAVPLDALVRLFTARAGKPAR